MRCNWWWRWTRTSGSRCRTRRRQRKSCEASARWPRPFSATQAGEDELKREVETTDTQMNTDKRTLRGGRAHESIENISARICVFLYYNDETLRPAGKNFGVR